ncbi:MAG: cell division protein ZapA [Lachnospiraceae bacterium]|nr:cell division protein ZapA [Lachnospiraceae bacterium]
MQTRNDIEVIINNKKYNLSGYESGEYLRSIAAYLNSKFDEFSEFEAYNKLEQDMRSVLMEINLADDYFKAKKEASDMVEDAERMKKEIFDMKHELMTQQHKMEKVQKELHDLKFQYLEAQKQIVRLETELEERKRMNNRNE